MSTTQKAIVLRTVGGELNFEDIPIPTLEHPHDILVKVMAVALNPVDFKVKDGRKGGASNQSFEPRKILGFDAAGIVHATGKQATNFKVGDEVYYAGSIARDGSFQQYQLVDDRVAALKPKSLSFEDAAALPLTSITAYEAMKELMRVEAGKSILITAGAGGVGSVATQLAKHWKLKVIATASRPETEEWTRAHGTDIVIDHKKGIAAQFKEKQLDKVNYCFNTFGDSLLPEVVAVIANFGAICGINGDITAAEAPSIGALFPKRVAYYQEYMFAKVVYGQNEQSVGDLLREVAELVDRGVIVSTAHTRFSWKDVKKAFEYLQSRTVIGKVVMTIDENQTSKQ